MTQVGDAPIQWKLIHLKVSGVQHGACSGSDKYGECIRNRVVNRDELAFKRTKFFDLVFLYGERIRLDAMLGKLRFYQRESEFGTDEGNIGTFLKQIRYRPNVVFVPVSENHGDYIIQAIDHIAEVGQD